MAQVEVINGDDFDLPRRYRPPFPRRSAKRTDRHKTAPASSTETRPGEPERRMRSEKNDQPSDSAASARASSGMTSSSVAERSCGAWNSVTVVTSWAFESEIRTEVVCPS